MGPWTRDLVDRALSMTRNRFDRRIMNNIHRSEYVECLVAEVLGEGWVLPWLKDDHDWAPWDLEHRASGTKLEVKQSAIRQTWGVTKRPPRYDIAYRTGLYDEDGWRSQRARFADIYVFAWHPVADAKLVDHRDPAQWEFYVLPASDLPEQKTIALTRLRTLTGSVPAARLAQSVTALTYRRSADGDHLPAHGDRG